MFTAVATSRPDVVLMDIGMPLSNGIDVIRRLRTISPATKIIILTAHNQPEYVTEVIRAGASGYVLKSCAYCELMIAIRQVVQGYLYLTASVSQAEISKALKSPTWSIHRSLTSRQREVLQLIAEGRTAKEIASALKLSVKTAVFHRMAIMDKLDLRSTAALTRYALDHAIVPGAAERELLPLPISEIHVDHGCRDALV